MGRQIIHPSNEKEWLSLRTQDITSTEIGALFGLSPYITEFELWHRKKNQTEVAFEENERMKWGTILQDSIAKGIAEEKGWKIRRMEEYIRGSDLRIGASFDFSIEPQLGSVITTNPPKDIPEVKPGLLEIKNVDSLQFKQKWIKDDDGELEAPLHIEIQVQHQLLCSGRQYAYIGALVGGNSLTLLKRTRNKVVLEKIKEKVAAFWASIEANTPPEPNFQTDSEFVASLYGFAEPGKFADVTEDKDVQAMATQYKQLGDEIKTGEKTRKELKAKILQIIGDAEKVEGGQFSISAGMVGPAHVEYDREGYRMFKINWRKKK